MDEFEGPTLNGAPYTIFRASHPGALLLGADTPLGAIMQATQAAGYSKIITLLINSWLNNLAVS